jgi:hypothetical protein
MNCFHEGCRERKKMGKNIGASDAGDFASAFSCLKSQQRAGEIPAEIETTDTKKHSPNNIINETDYCTLYPA